MSPDEVSRDRWLSGLEKEKQYNREREDIKRRLSERRVVWSRLLDLLEGEVDFDNSKRILDVGAEATSVFLALRKGEKYAVDPLFDYLFDLHPFLREVEEYQDVHFISTPIEDMASDMTFDIIFMLASLDHVGKIEPIIGKVDEILAPSGDLVIFADCYKDPAVKRIMNFFDLYSYHPHHFVAEDIISLFPKYRLKKHEPMSEIYNDCPFKESSERIRPYRLDNLVARAWRLQYKWGKGRDILFVPKLFLCHSLAFSTALLRRKERPIYPFAQTQLFVFQKR